MWMDTKTQIVLLGRRKLLALHRRRDAIELLALAVIWVPTLLFIAEVGWGGFGDLIKTVSTLNRLSALIVTSLLIVHIALVLASLGLSP